VLGKWYIRFLLIRVLPFDTFVAARVIRVFLTTIFSSCTWALVAMLLLELAKKIYKKVIRRINRARAVLNGHPHETAIQMTENILNIKIFRRFFIGILLIQFFLLLIQSLLFDKIDQGDSMYSHSVVFPFGALLDEKNMMLFCAAIASLFTWALIVVLLLSWLNLMSHGVHWLYDKDVSEDDIFQEKMIQILEKWWSFKIFGGVLTGIFLIQLSPFFILGKWDAMLFYYVVYPFANFIDVELMVAICAIVASSFILTLIVMAFYSILKLFFK
jgi:hypothetical protein